MVFALYENFCVGFVWDFNNFEMIFLGPQIYTIVILGDAKFAIVDLIWPQIAEALTPNGGAIVDLITIILWSYYDPIMILVWSYYDHIMILLRSY